MHTFFVNKEWTAKYIFTEVKGKAVCLVCGAQVAVLKDYNLTRHYATKHAEKYKNFSDEDRGKESDALLTKLQNQQGFFFMKLHASRDAAAKASYVIYPTKLLETVNRFLMESLLKNAWWTCSVNMSG